MILNCAIAFAYLNVAIQPVYNVYEWDVNWRGRGLLSARGLLQHPVQILDIGLAICGSTMALAQPVMPAQPDMDIDYDSSLI